MGDVERRGDDDRGADIGPDHRHLAPDQPAHEHREGQAQIFERRHRRHLAGLEGLHPEILADRGRRARCRPPAPSPRRRASATPRSPAAPAAASRRSRTGSGSSAASRNPTAASPAGSRGPPWRRWPAPPARRAAGCPRPAAPSPARRRSRRWWRSSAASAPSRPAIRAATTTENSGWEKAMRRRIGQRQHRHGVEAQHHRGGAHQRCARNGRRCAWSATA